MLPDIYYDKNYAKLYLNDNEKIETFEINNEYGLIKHIFIKREIENKVDNIKYYDLISPYGYNGPIVIDSNNKEKLVNSFKEEFSNYCNENNIISEFVRFHPILRNHNDFKDVYNPEYMRKTVGTNLIDYEDPVLKEFSKSSRRDIRQTLNKGVSYKVHTNVTKEVMNNFSNIYEETMKRLNADDFYFFGDKYFMNLLNSFSKNIVIVEAYYDGVVIGSDLYMIYDKFIHLHLSGTKGEYLNMAPAYILRYAMTNWGKENGYNVIHHGGGTTNDENDGLLKFKQRFGRQTSFDYYISKKIWNKNIYDKLVEKNNKEENELFPKYR